MNFARKVGFTKFSFAKIIMGMYKNGGRLYVGSTGNVGTTGDCLCIRL